jgi:hypothetical protein
LVCASVLRSLLPAAPPASPVPPALAPARGMIGRVLYAKAFFLCLIYTVDSQPTDKVEVVGGRALLKKKPRAGLQRGKQARTSTQREKPNARLQRGKQARTSTQRVIRGCWFVLLYLAPCRPLPRPRRPLP